jgi:hypothetical protein
MGREATGGSEAIAGAAMGGTPPFQGGAAGAGGTQGNEDRNTCATGPAKGKTCEDYCDTYLAKCGDSKSYGAYQDLASSEGHDGLAAGRDECLAECKRFSLIYDDDLCCRLNEAAQATSAQDQHCKDSVFFWVGVCGNGNVRDSTCNTGPQSGKTCKDFCDTYSERTKCNGNYYLGWDDCYFSCKTQSIIQPSLCCRLAEVAQANGPDDAHCENARVYQGSPCDMP